MCLQIEELLSIADFGPPEAEETSQNDSRWVFLKSELYKYLFSSLLANLDWILFDRTESIF